MPVSPAPEHEPVISYPTPQLLDRHLLERVSTKIKRHKALQPGTPHPNARDFAGFVFLKQLPPSPTEPDWYLRIWTNGRANQNTYNAEISYAEESNDHPIFLREYLELRSTYAAVAKLTAMPGLYKATITNGGTGFAQDTAALVLTGGTGSGGVLIPIVANGAITHAIIIATGTYSVAPTLSATGGSGFTGTVSVQPQTAVLVKEETGRLTDEMDALYVKVRRVYETLPGPLLSGQEYDRRSGQTITYTEQVQASTATPAAKTEVTPIDTVKKTHRTVTVPTAEIESAWLGGPGTENPDLPDVLTGITVTFNKTVGEGSHSEAGDGVAVGENASLTLHLTSRAQSSAAVIPDAQPAIKEYPRKVDSMDYFFFMADQFTKAALLNRLNLITAGTVLAWPVFKPESITLTAKGQQVSVAANADVQQHVSLVATNTSLTYGTGSGNSKETGASNKSIYIRPTLHAAITLSGSTDSQPIEAEAAADLGDGGSNWPARSIAAPSTTATASGSVTPTSIPATSPTGIPTTGLYLFDSTFSPSEWDGYVFVHAKVIDFAQFA